MARTLQKTASGLALATALALPTAALPQTTDEERDRGFLAGLIEDNLSSEGREVLIEGFKGALSSKATIDSISISDVGGEWLRIEGAELDWNRGALLDGRIDINTLTADKITLSRLPLPADATGPTPEAKPFALPQLPVSLKLGDLVAQDVILGAPILGVETSVSVVGNATLADGAGTAELAIVRADGNLGVVSLSASYDNNSTDLWIDLAVEEAANGILAGLIDLPGQPAIDLRVSGDAPLAAFVAQISLATDNKPRLDGTVKLTSHPFGPAPTDPTQIQPQQRVFDANLSGDIAPVFLPAYQDFFGDQIELIVTGKRDPDGRLAFDRLDLTTKALSLQGDLVLGSDSLPEDFALDLQLGRGDAPVLLPLNGTQTYVDSARILARYDARQGETYNITADMRGLDRDGIKVAAASLTGKGAIGRQTVNGTLGTAAAPLRAVTSALSFTLNGLSHPDPAIQDASGDSLTGTANLTWRDGLALQLDNLDVQAGGLFLSANGSVDGLSTGYAMTGSATLEAPDLSRFSQISGQNLKGSGRVELTGEAVPLAGSFDAELAVRGQDLGAGVAALDDLIAGPAGFDLSARRDETGTHIRSFALSSTALKASGKGLLASTGSTLDLAANLDNLARLAPGVVGPLSLKGTAAGNGGQWNIDLAADGPGGSTAKLVGLADAAQRDTNLDITGTLPLGLVNTFIDVGLVQGIADFNLALRGAFDVRNLSGQVRTDGTRISVPSAGGVLENVTARVDLSGGAAQLATTASLSTGGNVTIAGSVGLTAPYIADVDLTLDGIVAKDPKLYQTQFDGALKLTGPAMGAGRITGRIDLGRTEIRVPSGAIGAGADLPDIIHIAEPSDVRRTRGFAGMIGTSSGGGGSGALALDVVINAPGQIFVRGRGLDAEMGGSLRVTGNPSNIVPIGSFSLNRGRLDILGKRLDLTEGSLVLQGSAVPSLDLLATTATDDVTVFIRTSGPIDAPVVTFTSNPERPEDEVLAFLLFGKGLATITPLQAAQLASAVATLAGKGGDGIVAKIRRNFGLDDLDIASDGQGTTAVRLGKYLSDNVYTDVVVDSSGKSEINLNLDVSSDLQLKANVGSDGTTGIGVYFNKDY